MINRLAKIFFRIVLAGFILVNLVIAYFGTSTILLTFACYILIFIVFDFVVKKMFSRSASVVNYRLFLLSTILVLLISELFLRYVAKAHLTYNERNSGLYRSIYTDSDLRRAISRLRQPQDVQVYNHPPGTAITYKNKEYSYVEKFNTLGLRGPLPVEDTSLYTIAYTGDSFAEGRGAPDDSTCPKLLEQYLNQNSKIKFQCINGGCAGNDPFYEYMLLKKLLLPYKPKMVIIDINSTDVNDVIIRGGMERFSGGGVHYNKAPWWIFIYQFSYISRQIIHYVYGSDWLFLSKQQRMEQDRIALSKIKECLLKDFALLASQNKFSLVLVLHPTEDELVHNNFPLMQIAPDLEAANIKVVNLFDTLKSDYPAEIKRMYWKTDLHDNSFGYNIEANILARSTALHELPGKSTGLN